MAVSRGHQSGVGTYSSPRCLASLVRLGSWPRLRRGSACSFGRCQLGRLTSCGAFRLMLGDQAIEFGDALALGRALRKTLEPTGGPQRLAFGLQRLFVEIGHQSCSRPLAPM